MRVDAMDAARSPGSSPRTSSARSSARAKPSGACPTKHGGTGGAIVNVSSGASRLGSPGEYVDYAASKGALDTMTIGLAQEVAEEGIRVNAVRAGLHLHRIHAQRRRAGSRRTREGSVPMKRGGQPEEVARGDPLAAVGRGVVHDGRDPRRRRRKLDERH